MLLLGAEGMDGPFGGPVDNPGTAIPIIFINDVNSILDDELYINYCNYLIRIKMPKQFCKQ